MNFTEYQAEAIRTAQIEETLVQHLVHASLGLATETGEFTTEVKRIARYGKPCSADMRIHMLEELGDVMWYIALACEALQSNMEEIAVANIQKLRLRFPEKFSNEAAEARADKGGAGARES